MLQIYPVASLKQDIETTLPMIEDSRSSISHSVYIHVKDETRPVQRARKRSVSIDDIGVDARI